MRARSQEAVHLGDYLNYSHFQYNWMSWLLLIILQIKASRLGRCGSFNDVDYLNAAYSDIASSILTYSI